MLILIAALAAFSGFTAICASMAKHQRDIWKSPPTKRLILVLRLVGCLLLALSWAACAGIWGAGMGTVAWVCCLGLAPMVLVFSLAYAPKKSAMAGGLAGALAGCMAIVAVIAP